VFKKSLYPRKNALGWTLFSTQIMQLKTWGTEEGLLYYTVKEKLAKIHITKMVRQ